jgi:Mrp family chromosome partitioning ATPase
LKKLIVCSGKGGVGKTTVTVYLARALIRRGYRVGILDADINTSNAPIVLGFAERKPHEVKDYKIVPHEKDGVKIVSYWFDTLDSVPHLLWSADRVSRILKAYCKDVDWGDIDVLLTDVPPTSSDELVGVINLLGHIHGAILVVQGSTRSSVQDAKLAKATLDYFNVPVLGFVQNMVSDIFDEGIDVEKELGVPKLGEIKLKKKLSVKDFEPVVDKLKELEVIK